MSAAERNRRYREKLLSRSDDEIHIPETQTCSACRIEKPADAFDRSKAEKNGLKRHCRSCRADQHAAKKDARGRKRRLNVSYMQRRGIEHETPPIEIVPDGRIMRVPLGKGEFATIDADDWPLVAGWHWYKIPSGYAVRGAQREDGRRKLISMHRVIFWQTDAPEIDHADRDKLNNRRCNLRAATREQNVVNRGPSPLSATGIKGVSRTKGGRWRAIIYHGYGNAEYLGTFDTSEEAARAYDAAARRRRGEFEYINLAENGGAEPPV